MSDKPSKRLIITFPGEMFEDLQNLAAMNRRKMAEEVRIAVEYRLKQIKMPEPPIDELIARVKN